MSGDYEALDEARNSYLASTRSLPEAGRRYAEAEAEYQKAKAVRVMELRDEKVPATLIALMVKGDPAVNRKLFDRDSAKSLYEATNKAIDTYKLDARLLESRIQRDWNSQGGIL